ncbi:MAG: hypothetical protein K2K74_18505 [Lachnospiraceae bacterium]|nr:hypothetical protein [Lachnospiraceae bacterium]
MTALLLNEIFECRDMVLVENIGDNHLVMSENVVTVFDDIVTTIKKVQKMNEYLYEITCDESVTTNLSDEEIIHVVANEKSHANRKKKIKNRNIYCKGDLVEK